MQEYFETLKTINSNIWDEVYFHYKNKLLNSEENLIQLDNYECQKYKILNYVYLLLNSLNYKKNII